MKNLVFLSFVARYSPPEEYLPPGGLARSSFLNMPSLLAFGTLFVEGFS